MKCERCGRNEATYFVRSNVNGRVTEAHLCPACARAMGVAGRTSLWDDDFFTRPFSLLEPFFGAMGQGLLGEFPAPDEPDTPAQPRKSDELLTGAEQEKLQNQCRRNALESQLKDAVEREDYESAARLRDELKQLPQTI